MTSTVMVLTAVSLVWLVANGLWVGMTRDFWRWNSKGMVVACIAVQVAMNLMAVGLVLHLMGR